jgi:hypothetical protein
MRSGSQLGHFTAAADLSLVSAGIQNVIQAIPRKPYLHEDLACAATIVRRRESI